MKRLFALIAVALLLPFAALAQTVTINFIPTPAAIAAAGSSANLATAINAAVTNIQTHYTDSGANWTLNIASGAGYGPVISAVDSFNGFQQQKWVQDQQKTWSDRTGYQSSITVLVNGATGTTTSIFWADSAAHPQKSIIVTPYGGLAVSLEAAINGAMGVVPGSGYGNRMRILPNDANFAGGLAGACGGGLSGLCYCYHTLDSTGSDAGQVVYYPDHYSISNPNGGPPSIAQTDAPTANGACLARFQMLGGPTASYNTSDVLAVGALNYCEVWNNASPPVRLDYLQIIHYGQSDPQTITCSEETVHSVYSKDGNLPYPPYVKIGDATHKTVNIINASGADGWKAVNNVQLEHMRSWPINFLHQMKVLPGP